MGQSELYEKMKTFFVGNVGAVLALYDPIEGETARNYKGDLVEVIKATNDLKEFRRCVYVYMLNTELAGNPGPHVQYNSEKTQLFILPPGHKTQHKK